VIEVIAHLYMGSQSLFSKKDNGKKGFLKTKGQVSKQK